MIDCRRPFSQAPWLLMETSSVLRRPLAEYSTMLPAQCMLNNCRACCEPRLFNGLQRHIRAHIPQASMNTLYAALRPYERQKFSSVMQLVTAWHV